MTTRCYEIGLLLAITILLLTGCVTAVDDGLPYRGLPTVEVGVPVSLIASPSHPTSYLSGEMAAGTTVTVLGADPSQQWLFVADGNQFGWMPTFYSRNGVGRLEPAVTIDPLPADCTKYLDGTSDPEGRWNSFTDGSVIVLGSILRPHAGDDFDDAELNVSIDGAGVVTTADYVHVLLTRNEAIVLFGVAIDELDRGSQISFSLENAGTEDVIPQTAFFANSCPEELPLSGKGYTDTLPIGTYRRSASTAMPVLPTDTPSPETTGSTPQSSPVPPTPTPTPTPIVRESGPPKSSSSLRAEIELVLQRWDEIHHEVDRTLDPTDLPLVLTGDALAQQRKTLQSLRDNDCYWIFEDLAPAEVRAIDQISSDEVVVDARKHWDGDFYCDGEYDARSSFDEPFFVRYTLIRSADEWRVTSKEVIDEDEVRNADDLVPPVSSTPAPASADQQLKNDLLAKSRRSSVTLAHRQQAGEYADALIAHLDEFRMPGIGVTERSMSAALARSDAGDRLNCLVQEVWDEWSDRARQNGFDAYTADPGSMGFSPFRQLTIRLIQDRQGRLSEAQQHALHNYFTRSESSNAWRNDPDGIIGAINRESFHWP